MSDFTRRTAQMLFQQPLPAVVRALRNITGQSEEEAIEQFLADTKKEVGSATQSVKVIAIQKAIYFHMLGYSAAYAAFNVVEVMADPMFSHKRVGYLAACATFTKDTDVIPLMTALLKRDLCSANQYEAGMALYCISSICTPDLAKDVVADVVKLLNHPRTYVRKKAVLSLYKIFLQYPESLRPTYPRLKDKLDDNSEQCDSDPAVRGAVVCVLCELARRNPANFLGLAVPFYALLSSVQSNWTLIKIVKVFGYFAPVEPRLGKKLVEPLTNLITTTGAKSVQYECLLAVANGMGKVPALTKLAAEKLRGFIADPDQNLKFLGLEALSRMVGDNAKLLLDQRRAVLDCLDDNDVTVRCKALEVLRDLVTKKTITSTIDAMLDRCVREPVDETWSNAVIACIVETARTDDYGLIQDFEWYLGVLLEICEIDITEFEHGALVEHEIVTILTRVNGARQFGVEQLSALLGNNKFLRCDRERSTQWMVLRAAAFACGEYPYWIPDRMETSRFLLAEGVTLLPANAQVTFVTALGKIVAFARHPAKRHVELRNGEEELVANPETTDATTTFEDLKALISSSPATDDTGFLQPKGGLDAFLRSVYPDVQERARLVFYQITAAPDVGPLLYEKEILPVADGAQDALEVPAGLDLDKPFCDNVAALMALSESEHSGSDDDSGASEEGGDADFNLTYRIEQQKRLEKARRQEVSAFYLRDNNRGGEEEEEGEQSRSREKTEDRSLGDATAASSRRREGAKASRLRDRLAHGGAGGNAKKYGINRELVRPATYVDNTSTVHGRGWRRTNSPEEDEATKKLRNIDVTRSLGADEKLPEAVPYALLLQEGGVNGSVGTSNRGHRSGARPDDGFTASARGAWEDTPLPPVTLFEEKLCMRAVLHVDGCKVKKDGTHLRFTLELTNLAVTSALHDVTLSLVESDAYTSDAVSILPGESAGGEDRTTRGKDGDDDEEVDGKDEGWRAGVKVSERVKGNATVRCPFVLRLSQPLPDSIVAAVPISVGYVKDKKRGAVSVQVQPRYVYFTKPAPLNVAMDDFNEKVLLGSLKHAPVVSAVIPCTKAAMMYCAPTLQRELRFAPVEVFKDAATFYGVLHGRKSIADRTHVAVLLREAEEDGAKGIGVSVRIHSTSLAELIIHDIAAIVQSVDLK